MSGRPEGTATSSWQHMSSYDGNTNVPGYAHVSVANCIGRANQSPDGTFTIFFGVPATGPYVFPGLSHMRLDDTEEGDVWLFGVKACAQSHGINLLTDQTARYTGANSAAVPSDFWTPYSEYTDSTTAPFWSGWRTWRGRGMVAGATGFPSTTDRYLPALGHYPWNHRPGHGPGVNSAEGESVKAAAVTTVLRDHPLLATHFSGYKYRKGRARWLAMITGSPQAGDTFVNKQWVCLRDITPNNHQLISPIVGPWDGTSTPLVG